MKQLIPLCIVLLFSCLSCQSQPDKKKPAIKYSIVKTDAEWRKQLTAEQFEVTRRKGTERAYTGKYWDNHTAGTYTCVCCALPLFNAAVKFDSGTGWPSFWRALPGAVGTSTDWEVGYPRTEVHCARCGGHLGHVFDDGPRPTGKRYCMNGDAMLFRPA